MTETTPPEPESRIDRITTRWTLLDADHRHELVLCYGKAIRRYLGALVKNDDDADDLAQEIIGRVVARGFPGVERRAGKAGVFRNYLKEVLRNEVRSFWRSRRSRGLRDRLAGLAFWRRRQADAGALAAELEARLSDADADHLWLAEWRSSLSAQAQRALRALKEYQDERPGNLFATVLELILAYPEERSDELARRLAERTGQPHRADAVRQTISRARRKFAELLVEQVSRTVEPTPDAVEDELAELGLLPYVRRYLPPDWRERGVLADAEE